MDIKTAVSGGILATVMACHAQAISSSWFPGNLAGGNLSCSKPANIAVASGLVLTMAQQTLLCGSATTPLASYSYTNGLLQWNALSVTYGNIAYRAAMPSAGANGAYAALWLLGVSNSGSSNCQTLIKTNMATSGDCLPGQPAYTEIDMTEVLGSTSQVNQQIHVSTGNHNDNCAPSVTNTAFHNYEVDWSAGSLVWLIDGVPTCTITQSYVPSVPMFLIIQTAVWMSPVPADFPSTLNVSYVRVCPTSTAPGNCTSANATIFDDEFTGTGSQAAIYVGQGFAGAKTGADCADSYGILNGSQVSWINDPGYWTNGIIGPGTNIHLCGAISTQPIAQGSGGSNGNVIKFIVEPGGLVQNPRINTNGQTNLSSSPPQLIVPSTYVQDIGASGTLTIQ
jgi:hypothetical protein